MSRQEQVTGAETARWHDFGAWLAQTRVDLGYTQAHVASQADISTQSLVSLEHGGFRRYADGPWILPNPRDDTLVSLARLYGVKAEEMFKRVGRYADRPQTKTTLHRRGRVSSRQPARGDRIAELEARFEEDLRRTRERTEELEERQRRIEEALRKAGIPLDGASLAAPERSRRRRATG
jgi:transcriptional regulator with XRE-family HTH domain